MIRGRGLVNHVAWKQPSGRQAPLTNSRLSWLLFSNADQSNLDFSRTIIYEKRPHWSITDYLIIRRKDSRVLAEFTRYKAYLVAFEDICSLINLDLNQIHIFIRRNIILAFHLLKVYWLEHQNKLFQKSYLLSSSRLITLFHLNHSLYKKKEKTSTSFYIDLNITSKKYLISSCNRIE